MIERAIGKFKLLKAKGSHDQIADHLRKEIYSGNLKPGAKLPTNLELAVHWETHGNTIQRAMGPLVKEGLLVRIPRVGTFIREREKKLTCVAVYGDCGLVGAQSSPYTHAIDQALREELGRAGIKMDFWMDSRLPEQHGEPWDILIKAAEQRQFQALIVTKVTEFTMPWQRKLSVPVAFLGASPSTPNNVDHDTRQFIEISLRDLARQGCRSVGLIAPMIGPINPANPEEEGRISMYRALEHFTDVAGELGLTVKKDWMRVRGHGHGVSAAEHFGYDEFLKLWSQPDKPEGLVVFCDVTARGVLMAIQKKDVRVPQDLKLALHKNESIDLFCPMPATFVVSSEREMARALIKQVKKQFRGELCERISLPFKLVAHGN